MSKVTRNLVSEVHNNVPLKISLPLKPTPKVFKCSFSKTDTGKTEFCLISRLGEQSAGLSNTVHTLITGNSIQISGTKLTEVNTRISLWYFIMRHLP